MQDPLADGLLSKYLENIHCVMSSVMAFQPTAYKVLLIYCNAAISPDRTECENPVDLGHSIQQEFLDTENRKS